MLPLIPSSSASLQWVEGVCDFCFGACDFMAMATGEPISVLRRKVYLTRVLPSAVEERIAGRYEVVRTSVDRVVPPAELAKAAVGYDYIITSAMQPITREVFEALAGTLKAIGTLSVGYNHIDVEAAKEFGVSVFYSPGVLSDACAEMTVMLLLNAARRGHEADAMVRAREWRGYAPTQLLGIGLTGRRVGILGMGRIGQATAKRLAGFGVELHYHNRRPIDASEGLNAVYHETAESLLRVSDFLVILAPSTPELHKFLNRDRIALLPPNAVVVNTSRGDLVDDDALIEALKSGRIFAAGLDVFAGEPELDLRYLPLINVFLTPHIASATTDARNSMGFLVLDGLLAFEEGRRPENQLC
jgi:lactate dehydrogenase-like 2-hydroxyacid dehydrogenase